MTKNALPPLPAIIQALRAQWGRLAAVLCHLLARNRREEEPPRMAAALRDSVERLNLALDATHTGLWDVDFRSGQAHLSDSYYTMLGYAPGEFPASLDGWASLMPKEEREANLAYLRRQPESDQEIQEWPHRLRDKQGEWRWILAHMKVIARDGAGRPTRMLGINMDLTRSHESVNLLALLDQRAHALLQLPQAAERMDEGEFLQFGLELAERLTASGVSFLHFVDEDQETIELAACSESTLAHYRQAAHEPHYPITQAGIWADAVRQRAPVVIDDHAGAKNKHGLPADHAELIRLISIPVIEENQVRMLVGVGNKTTRYTPTDLETLQLLGNELWRIMRKQRAERLLRQSETRFRDITEISADWVWEVDTEGRYTYASDNIRHILGYAPEEILGKMAFDFMPPQDLPRLRQEFAALVAGGKNFRDVDNVIRHKDGGLRHILTSGTPIRNERGELLGYRGVDKDITLRKQTENELSKLSLAVEQSPASILITDLDANIEYVNAAFVQSTGYGREEAIGQNPRFLRSGNTPPHTFADMWDALRQGRIWKGKFFNRRKNGSEFVEFVFIAPIRQADGQISHYLGIKEDITEKERMGRELDRYRLHLEELVEERTRDLARAKEAAETATRAKSAFLASMSHEIRTPLNAVLGFAQVGEADSRGFKVQAYFRQILDSGQLLLGIINDILDFSKIEAGKLYLENRRLDLAQILERATSQVKQRAASKGLLFRVETADDLPATCLGDELRLAQVLTNLLSNAVKFTPKGTVSLSLSRNGDNLVFRIADTGIGMSAGQIECLFRPFEQADNSITRKFGGTGLGLSISKRLVDAMHGSIRVESQPQRGSLFEVCLPLLNPDGRFVLQAQPQEAARPAAVGPRLRGLSLLVAEDNGVNRLVLENMLAREGCRLTLVENGLLAVEKVRESGGAGFDLVLMDIQMPEMDGYEATRQILRLAPGLPVVGLTAYAMSEERERSRAAGMLDHVAKPVERETLIAAILRQVRPDASPIAAETAVPLPSAEETEGSDAADLPECFIDWRTLEAKYLGQRDFLLRLLTTLSQANAAKPKALHAAAQLGEAGRIAEIAHGIKGMGGDILPRPLRQLAARTERAARAEEPDAPLLAARLADALFLLLEEISAYLGDQAQTVRTEAPVDWERIVDVLARLESLLAISDTAANDLFEEAQPLLAPALDYLAEQLGERIRLFDYAGALETLDLIRTARIGL